MPIASTSPNSDRLLRLNPKAASTANAPISEIGMATIGTTAARQLWRNTSTTIATSTIASNKVCWTAEIEAEMYVVGL